MITCRSIKFLIFFFLPLRAMEAILVNEWSKTSEPSQMSEMSEMSERSERIERIERSE